MQDKNQSSAGYSITVRLTLENRPGRFASVVTKVGEMGASVAEVTLLSSDFNENVRDFVINCISEDHSHEVVREISKLTGITTQASHDNVIEMHRNGKLDVNPTVILKTRDQLSQAYTPGVARICSRIHENPLEVYDYTIKSNTVAVVTDGSAVLGLGNIGAEAGMPVMEGKAMLFKQFAGLNAFPICLDTQDTEEIIATVKHISPGFGGINLEDISAPRCFEIEDRLIEELDIPVFHDDQHGTACVVLAGVLNALKIIGKDIADVRLVMSGFGAGGVACSEMLIKAGAKNLIPCDSVGIVYRGRKERMNPVKEELLKHANPDNEQGSLKDALKGADVFVGVSRPGVLTREMVKTMASDPVVFALANPIPEVMPHEIEDLARVIATGRSDYANQVNNVLCFPGIFKGALDIRATKITENMKLAAACAIAEAVPDSELREDFIIPSVFDHGVSKVVAKRVQECAIKDGVARSGMT